MLAFCSILRLGQNQLCGLNYKGEGTYTTEGIVAICAMLKLNSSLMSLECAPHCLTHQRKSVRTL